MESMMTARQVAELLGVHENWVYDQAAGGELPSYKIGGTRRFDPEELRRWIGEHREQKQRARRREPPQSERGRERQSERSHPESRSDDGQPRLFE